jgi:NifB/MoaA-like Fe-S oxidoreductase
LHYGDEVMVITGEYAAPILRQLFDEHGYGDVQILSVSNAYFGGNIKVAGLLTGQDLIKAVADVAPSTVLLLPDVCLSEGRFLDGLGVEDLGHRVITIRTTGHDLRTTLEMVRATRMVAT